jgi:glucose/mannose transport system substrate-binding protein
MRWSIVGAGVLLAVAAAAGAVPTKSGAADSMSFYHWWTSPSELAAVEALVEGFKKQHPGVAVHPVPVDSHGGGRRIFTVIRTAATGRQPPDAFQVHTGAALQPYFDAGLLSPIDDVWKSEGLEKVVPRIIRTMSSIDQHYYSLPINVHRNNLIWYNKPLLDKHEIDPHALTTWDDLFRAAEKLRDAGVSPPVQLGKNWTLSLAFEGIMAGQGARDYEAWVNGRLTAPEDRRLLQALGTLKTYLSYANKDHATTEWDVAIRRVASGESAFCIMGDWAHGEFRLAKQKYGKDYGAVPVPGTMGMYGIATDSFAKTSGIADATQSDRFMRFAASHAGQDAFNLVKGSISARTDADPSKYDPYQKAAMADFKTARHIYPNLASGTHDAYKAGVDDLMTRFGADLDTVKAAAALAQLASRSQKKFIRVWTLD